MGNITKLPVQRIVTISLDANNQVTHAWQQTTFSIQEDGAEISRQQGGQDNVEPADIGAAVPQADLLEQLADQKAANEAAAMATAEASAKAIADRDALVADRDAQIAILTAAHGDLAARNAAAAAALKQ
ncbi:MAG: hypothetical protein JWO19_6108 [Bryobacterales bacterium]|nr:hypothetical protein [Bryobacterales bacterium]